MDINFVPAELRPRRPSKAPYLFAVMAYVFAILFFGTKIGMVKKIRQETSSDKKLLSTLNSNLSRYADANARLESTTSEAIDLMKKIENYKDIKKKKLPFAVILKETGNLTPEGLWFEELSIDYPSEKFNLIGFGTEPVEEKAFKFTYNLGESKTLKRFFNEMKLISCNPAPEREGLGIFVIEMVLRK